MDTRDKIRTDLESELTALRQQVTELEARFQQAQEEIRRLHEFNESIAQSMAEGVVVENIEGRFTFVNRAAAISLGYTVEELIGQHWTLVIPPDQWPTVDRANARRARGVADRYELDLLRKPGDRITVLVTGSPRLDPHTGEMVGTLAVFTDITELKRAEATLLESERLSRAVIENLPVGLSVRSQTGRLLYYNEAWKKIWAVPDEAIKLDLMRERTELSFDRRDNYLRPYQDDLRRLYSSGGTLHLPELRVTRPRPGAAEWIAQHFYAIKDEHDQVDRVVILTEDITERKRAEASEQRKSEFQSHLLDTARHLTSSLDVTEVLKRIGIEAKQILNALGCTIYLLEADGKTLTPVVSLDLPYDDEILATSLNIDNSMTGQAVRVRHGLIFNDAATNPAGHHIPGTPVEEEERIIAVPFVADERVLGAICLNRMGTSFAEEELVLAEAFATFASTALKNAQMHRALGREMERRKQTEQALTRRAHELGVLYETFLDINAQTELNALLRAIVERATDLLGAQMGGLYLLSPDGESLTLVVGHNLPGSYVGTPLHVGEGLSGRVAQTGKLMMVEDYSRWEGRAAPFATGDFHRVLAVPLKVSNRVIGVINITDDQHTGVFTEDEVRLANLFADQAALAIEKARLLEETRRRAERMRALNEIGQSLASTLGLRRLYQLIYEQACRVIKVDAFYIALYDETLGQVQFPFMYDEGKYQEPSTTPLGNGPTSQAIRTRTPFTVSQPGDPIQEGERFFGNLERPSASAMHVPMLAGDRVIGVISAQSYLPNAYDAEDVQVLQMIASQAGIAVENARLYQAERDQRDLAETLRETGAQLAASLDMGAVLDCIIQQISRVLPHDAADIMLVEGDQVRAARWHGYERFGAEEFIVTFSSPIVELYGLPKMIATGEPFFISDTQADARWVRYARTKWVRSYASAPLRVRGRVLGFINVNSATPNQFGQAEADRLSAFANQAALALANARLFQAEQEQRDLAETLRATGATLAATLDADAVLERLLDQISSVVPNDLATVLLIEEGIAHIVNWRCYTQPGITDLVRTFALKVDDTANLREMATTSKPIVIPDIHFFPGWVPHQQMNWTRSHIGAPIRVKGQVIGFLALYSAVPRFFTASHAARLQSLADQAAIALENARLYQAEQDQFRRWQESQTQLIQAEKMAALGRLIGSISHEFNNPLQAVIGAIELCREEVDGPTRREQITRYLSVVEKETDRIAAIVKRVRDFYRPVGSEQLHADLGALVRSVLDLIGEQLARHNILVVQELADLPLLRINPDDLKQVLFNVMFNALDAMAESGGTLRVRATMDQLQAPGAEPQPVARIEIGDTGVGIPPEMLPHIFEPFVTTRADQATPTATKAALGLSITYGLIQSHGGEIAVSSEPSQGTTFTILLPVELSQPS